MGKNRKWFIYLSKKEKIALVNEFMKYHPSMTEPCDFDFEYHDGSNMIAFFPKHGTALHHVENIVLFVQYHNASMFADVQDGKSVINVF